MEMMMLCEYAVHEVVEVGYGIIWHRNAIIVMKLQSQS